MFERLTDRARRVIVISQDEAKSLSHNYIGTEHLLLGLAFCEGIGARALEACGLSYGSIKAAIQPGEAGRETGHQPFTPRAKKVLELALREALQLGNNYIGTEHILLAVIKEAKDETSTPSESALVFRSHGVSLDAARQAVIQLLGESSPVDLVSPSNRAADSAKKDSSSEPEPIVIDGDNVTIRSSGALIDFDGDRDAPSFSLTIRRPDGRNQLVTFLFGVAEADG